GCRHSVRGVGGRDSTIDLPRAVLVCILLERPHGIGDHGHLDRDPVRCYANDGTDSVVGEVEVEGKCAPAEHCVMAGTQGPAFSYMGRPHFFFSGVWNTWRWSSSYDPIRLFSSMFYEKYRM